MSPTVSIINCTSNRAAHLKKTIESLGNVRVPRDLPAELIVVDNGSGDDSAEVVRNCGLQGMQVRFLREPRPGKSHALNTAISAARGDILLFSDDDLRFPTEWIAMMCMPILSGAADAVRGCIHMAPELRRPWLTSTLLARLAHNDPLQKGERVQLVGANMAISREVLEKVPGFDPEIGPGKASGGEDTLFSWQVEAAGFRLVSADNCTVTHHLDESRLQREKFLLAARRGGYGDAYIIHHWLHDSYDKTLASVVRAFVRLNYWRICNLSEWLRKDWVAAWEIDLTQDLHRHWHCWLMRKSPRNYDRNGLLKLRGETNAPENRKPEGKTCLAAS